MARLNGMRWLSALKYGAALAAFAMLPAAPAQAGSCADLATCTFDLTNTNVLGVAVDIRVTVDNSGANTQITFEWISDNLTNTALGIDQFGFNSAALTPDLPTAGWSNANCPALGCQIDGFGRFVSEIDNPGGTDLSFTFMLDQKVTTFTDNPNGGEFAAHIRYSGGCSAYVSDGTSNDVGANTACISEQQRVPEPNSLSMFGLALLALVGLRRVRRA